MLVTGDTVDTFHEWDRSNPHWIETFWYGAWIPEAATTVYIYQWFRPVLGIYGGGCFVWDGTACEPWNIPYFHYDVNRPISAPVDLRSVALDSGTSLRSVEEGMVYDVGFKRHDVEVAMRFEGVTPPEIVSSKGVSEFFNGHIDQAGRYTGSLRVASQSYAIDCFGIRDRSWGPRVITDDIRLNYCHGQSEKTAFVCYSKPDKGGESIFKGYVALSGESHEIASGRRTTEIVDGQLRRIHLQLVDKTGRMIEGWGEPLNKMAYQPYPGLLNWLYLIRWTFGSEIIYGEEQDVWSDALWRAEFPGRKPVHRP